MSFSPFGIDQPRLFRRMGTLAGDQPSSDAAGLVDSDLEQRFNDLVRRFNHWKGATANGGETPALAREQSRLQTDIQAMLADPESALFAATLNQMGDSLSDGAARRRRWGQAMAGLRGLPNLAADAARHRLQTSMDPGARPTTLMSEQLHDGEANCIEKATRWAGDGQHVVFMQDHANLDGDEAGHALIRDPGTGNVWDPLDGAPPERAEDWTYSSVDDWVERGAGGHSQYSVDADVPASAVRSVLGAEPGADREAALATLRDTQPKVAAQLEDIKNNRYAQDAAQAVPQPAPVPPETVPARPGVAPPNMGDLQAANDNRGPGRFPIGGLTRFSALGMLTMLSGDTPQPQTEARLVPGTDDLAVLVTSHPYSDEIYGVRFARVERDPISILGYEVGSSTDYEPLDVPTRIEDGQLIFDPDALREAYGQDVPGWTTAAAEPPLSPAVQREALEGVLRERGVPAADIDAEIEEVRRQCEDGVMPDNNLVGRVGEAYAAAYLQAQGYSDIVAVQNASGHGIDLVATKDGVTHYFEVKTTTGDTPPDLSPAQQDPEAFVRRRLERAVNGDGHWAPHNVAPGLRERASELLDELRDENANVEMRRLNVYLECDLVLKRIEELEW